MADSGHVNPVGRAFWPSAREAAEADAIPAQDANLSRRSWSAEQGKETLVNSALSPHRILD
jgi:hypothetical protein